MNAKTASNSPTSSKDRAAPPIPGSLRRIIKRTRIQKIKHDQNNLGVETRLPVASHSTFVHSDSKVKTKFPTTEGTFPVATEDARFSHRTHPHPVLFFIQDQTLGDGVQSNQRRGMCLKREWRVLTWLF